MKKYLQPIVEQKKWLAFSLISTFIWGMFAHAYRFFHGNVAHDSLVEFYSEVLGSKHKIALGRVFVPIYRDMFRGDILLPWLVGCLALIWIGLTVFLVLRIFQVENKVVAFLIAGVFSVNLTVSATAATYLHDLDCYMFSLLCAVAAVYAWKYMDQLGFLLGICLTTMSLGMYQSFVFVTVSLVMFVSLLALMNGEKLRPVLLKGLEAVGMILLGGVLYAIAIRVVLRYTGVEMYTGEYNSLDKMSGLTLAMLPGLCRDAYRNWYQMLVEVPSLYSAGLVKGSTLVLCAMCVAALAVWLLSRKAGIWEKLLGVCLAGLLPLGMNLIYVLTLGGSHTLMVYAVWLFYMFALLLADWLSTQLKEKKLQNRVGLGQKWLCMLLVAVLLYGNAQLANGMYMKKAREYDAHMEMMSRLVARMEANENYKPGETPVVFVGLPQKPQTLNPVAPGFEKYTSIAGLWSSDVIHGLQRERYKAYFDYVLGIPLMVPEQDVWDANVWCEESVAMEPYPASSCMEFRDGILVVRLG